MLFTYVNIVVQGGLHWRQFTDADVVVLRCFSLCSRCLRKLLLPVACIGQNNVHSSLSSCSSMFLSLFMFTSLLFAGADIVVLKCSACCSLMHTLTFIVVHGCSLHTVACIDAHICLFIDVFVVFHVRLHGCLLALSLLFSVLSFIRFSRFLWMLK